MWKLRGFYWENKTKINQSLGLADVIWSLGNGDRQSMPCKYNTEYKRIKQIQKIENHGQCGRNLKLLELDQIPTAPSHKPPRARPHVDMLAHGSDCHLNAHKPSSLSNHPFLLVQKDDASISVGQCRSPCWNSLSFDSYT